MTGRQLLRRPGYELDVDKVLKACAKHGVAVEINAHPWRLDLDWRRHQKALDYGCIFSINPDAHSIRELDHMHWGVEMARKGAVPRDRVLNAMGSAACWRTSQSARLSQRSAASAAWQLLLRQGLRNGRQASRPASKMLMKIPGVEQEVGLKGPD